MATVGSTFEIDLTDSMSGGPGTVHAGGTFLAAVKTTFATTAVYNDSTSAGSFGTYLPELPLNNTFTVTDVGEPQGAKLQYAFGSDDFQDATFSKTVDADTASNQWTFSADMGKLYDPATPLQLHVRSVLNDEVFASTTYDVDYDSEVALDLKAKANVGSDPFIPVDSVRLVDLGVNNPDLSFQADLSDLPFPDQYGPNLAVLFREQTGLQKNFYAGSYDNSSNTLIFQKPTGAFLDSTSGDKVQWSVYLVPSPSTTNLPSTRLSNSQSMVAIPRPDWLANASAQFVANDDVEQQLGTSAGYQFDLDLGKELSISLPTTNLPSTVLATIASAFTESSIASATFVLHVYAALSTDVEPKVVADSATAHLALLGYEVIPVGTDISKHISVTATLSDAVRLTSPTTIDIKVAHYDLDVSGLSLQPRHPGKRRPSHAHSFHYRRSHRAIRRRPSDEIAIEGGVYRRREFERSCLQGRLVRSVRRCCQCIGGRYGLGVGAIEYCQCQHIGRGKGRSCRRGPF